MKSKKLPKKIIGDFASQDEVAKKSGVKLAKSKRSKKPSIYDEMDDLEYFNNNNEFDVLHEEQVEQEDFIDDDDLYWSWINVFFKRIKQLIRLGFLTLVTKK